MSEEKYEAPQLTEIGEMAEVTQQYGLGFSEFLASIVTGSPIGTGSIFGQNFS